MLQEPNRFDLGCDRHSPADGLPNIRSAREVCQVNRQFPCGHLAPVEVRKARPRILVSQISLECGLMFGEDVSEGDQFFLFSFSIAMFKNCAASEAFTRPVSGSR